LVLYLAKQEEENFAIFTKLIAWTAWQ